MKITNVLHATEEGFRCVFLRPDINWLRKFKQYNNGNYFCSEDDGGRIENNCRTPKIDNIFI
jgi:hypothetical protein